MLTKQEKELLEECLDELYEDYGRYTKSLKKGDEMNATYKTFVSIVQKLGLRKPRQSRLKYRKLDDAKPMAQESLTYLLREGQETPQPYPFLHRFISWAEKF